MKKQNIVGLFIAAVLIVGVVLVAVQPQSAFAADVERRGGPGGAQSDGGNSRGSGSGTPMNDEQRGYGSGFSGGGQALAPLTPQEEQALTEAILEEYGALNLYGYIQSEYGYNTPFDSIAQSEENHANSLIRTAEKYGMTVPQNPGLEQVPTYSSMEEACQAGVAAEIADADLYDELLQLTDKTDLQRVFTNLQTASLDNHLPAFEECH